MSSGFIDVYRYLDVPITVPIYIPVKTGCYSGDTWGCSKQRECKLAFLCLIGVDRWVLDIPLSVLSAGHRQDYGWTSFTVRLFRTWTTSFVGVTCLKIGHCRGGNEKCSTTLNIRPQVIMTLVMIYDTAKNIVYITLYTIYWRALDASLYLEYKVHVLATQGPSRTWLESSSSAK